MLTAIIPAAGLSSRMGQNNKLLLPLGQGTSLQTVCGRLIQAGADDIIVVTGHDRELIEESLDNLPVRFVHNEHYEKGLTGSVQAGVAAARGTGYMICLADMPNIRSATYAWLMKQFLSRHQKKEKLICVPRFGTKRGNPLIFSNSFREEILNHTTPDGLKNIIIKNANGVLFCDIDDEGILQDMDTQRDYENRCRQYTEELK